jgi:hypothetical protein
MADFTKLSSVRKVSKDNPEFSEPSLRWIIFNAKTNGLESALVRVGSRVYIDTERFNEWLEERRGGK